MREAQDGLADQLHDLARLVGQYPKVPPIDSKWVQDLVVQSHNRFIKKVPYFALLSIAMILSASFSTIGRSTQITSAVYEPNTNTLPVQSSETTVWQKLVTMRTDKGVIEPVLRISLGLNNILAAQSATTLKTVWHQSLPDIATTSAPTIYQFNKSIRIAISTELGAIYNIDAETGSILWMQNVSSRVAVSPLSVDDKLIVACDDGRIYGLNDRDGQIDYLMSLDAKITALEPVASAKNQQVYVVADSSRVIALNSQTGELIWKSNTVNPIIESPLLSANRIITPTHDGHLWAYLPTGELDWMQSFERLTSLTAEDRYIALAQDNVITLVDARSGAPLHYWNMRNTTSVLHIKSLNNNVIIETDLGQLSTSVN